MAKVSGLCYRNEPVCIAIPNMSIDVGSGTLEEAVVEVTAIVAFELFVRVPIQIAACLISWQLFHVQGHFQVAVRIQFCLITFSNCMSV